VTYSIPVEVRIVPERVQTYIQQSDGPTAIFACYRVSTQQCLLLRPGTRILEWLRLACSEPQLIANLVAGYRDVCEKVGKLSDEAQFACAEANAKEDGSQPIAHCVTSSEQFTRNSCTYSPHLGHCTKKLHSTSVLQAFTDTLCRPERTFFYMTLDPEAHALAPLIAHRLVWQPDCHPCRAGETRD
jgi:hypothetical protein